ncbi:MAG: DNA-directed DNA polymerase I [Pyrodictiaceae archaeon]
MVPPMRYQYKKGKHRNLLEFLSGKTRAKGDESLNKSTGLGNNSVDEKVMEHTINTSLDQMLGEERVSETLEEEVKEGNEGSKDKSLEKQVDIVEERGPWIPRLGELKFPRSPRRADNGDEGYLLGSYYDGSLQKIYLKMYSPKTNEIIVYYDESGYKPYFLTDLAPDKVHSMPSIVSHPGFEHVEVVEKKDLLRNKNIKVTKIVVKTPDVVPILRSKVPRAWEAHIKFHQNYIYDMGLIPGLLYRIVNGKLVAVKPMLNDELIRKTIEAFAEEDEETKQMALNWLPLFESEPPRVPRLAVDIEVFTPFKGRVPDPNEASYPIMSIAFSSTDQLRGVFVLYREGLKLGDKLDVVRDNKSFIEVFDSEKAMILESFKILSNYPVVLSFNGDNFDLPYLYNRALKLGIAKEYIPIRFSKDYAYLDYGLHIDLYKFFSIKAIQSYAFGNSYKEFTLEAIASALLGETKIILDKNISDLTLSELVEYNLRDADLTLKLTTFNNELVWTLIILLMRISKLPLEDLTRSQISSWIKSLFYWEHRRRGYLIPTQEEIIKLKGTAKSDAIIKGKKYQGALVLDPPNGIYFNVVVLDFASLYPTIIKKWNLSYETVNPVECPGGKIIKVPDVGHTVCKSIKGITSQIVGLLRDYRVKIYKRKAKDKSLPPELRAWYDTVQAALKVYINASYGVFGASSFPLYSPPVAESVTAIGRYAIRLTLKKASELGLRVLYGDTDSLFLWNPRRELLDELIRYVNENFGLELEVDKVYRFVTFSGLKKNYIGVYPEGEIDIKGLIAKKRNTPEFLKKEFAEILELIGKIEDAEGFLRLREVIKRKIQEIYNRLKSLDYNLDELAIKVALNKPLEAYTKNTPQHVKAARQLVNAGIEVSPGDIISFVKTKSGEGVKPIQLARLVEVDVEKYIDYLKTTFEQVLGTLSINWDDIIGSRRLEFFFKRR